MPEPLHPTPYAGINAVLHHFLASIQAIVGSHFRACTCPGRWPWVICDPDTILYCV